MKLEQLHQLINANKKLVSIKKPIKRLFKAIVYSHTGKRIIKQFSEVRSDLKHDLEIIFKPIKRFTKKHLKGVDVKSLNAIHKQEQDEIRGTHTLPDELSQRSTIKEPEFINWFDVNGNKEVPMKNTKCTYTDKYGNKVSLDESYEALQRD